MVLLFSLTASAQDVIVKKDGSTVLCRIVEVSKSEVVYKRWANLEGDNYVMSLTEVTAVNYEDGRRLDLSALGTTSTMAQDGQSLLPVSDADLLKMTDEKSAELRRLKKPKKLKKIGWSCGSILFAAGAACIITALVTAEEESYYSYCEYDYNVPLLVSGAAMAAGGITMATICQIRANRLQKSIIPTVQSTPILQREFRFKNHTALSPSLNSIYDNISRHSTLGLGLAYNF